MLCMCMVFLKCAQTKFLSNRHKNTYSTAAALSIGVSHENDYKCSYSMRLLLLLHSITIFMVTSYTQKRHLVTEQIQIKI